MPVTTEPVSRPRLGWVPGQRLKPGFGDVPTLSTPHRRFTCVRLLGPHLTRSRPALSWTPTPRGFGPSSFRRVWALAPNPLPRGPPPSLTPPRAPRPGPRPHPPPPLPARPPPRPAR